LLTHHQINKLAFGAYELNYAPPALIFGFAVLFGIAVLGGGINITGHYTDWRREFFQYKSSKY
jgi:hypothetical protein